MWKEFLKNDFSNSFHLWIDTLSIFYEIGLSWVPQNPIDDQVNIGAGNGLVPSGNEPLSEPMLTKIYVIIWRHKATMS